MDDSEGPHMDRSPKDDSPRRLINGRLFDEYYKTIPPNHFAPTPENQSLDIAIIGAGIAGLTSALALVQSGHNVEIFEKSQFANEIGAAINMCPNAARILSYYEFDFSRGMPTPVEEMKFIDAQSLKVLRHLESPDFEELYAAPYLLFHRVDLHSELKRLATEPRPHTSAIARINLSSEVLDIDLDGNLTLADGSRLKKDLIIVAEGIRTKFATKVVGDDQSVHAAPTGTAVYRFLIPTEKLLADQKTRHLYEGDRFSLVIAPYKDGRLVWYPCRGGALQNYGFFQPDPVQHLENEVWNIEASREVFTEACTVLHPDLQAVCSKAEDLKLWRLCSREKPIQTLVRGKVVLVGDAAHPMLPHQGQGGGMAVEDGAALGVLFSNLSTLDEVPDRLKLFQQLRLDRVSAMQIFSSVGMDEHTKIADVVRPYVNGPLPQTPEEYQQFNFTPNILRDASELLATHLARPASNKQEQRSVMI